MLGTPLSDPFALFDAWFAEAQASEPGLPHAMSLATVGAGGLPTLRMVLHKDADARGFVFYTNTGSRKATDIKENGNVALCFHWKSLGRQVRIEGPVAFVTDAEADEYWQTRPRGAQIGAWASKQSQCYANHDDLVAAVNEFEQRFDGHAVPRPSFWTGYRVRPSRIEFWQDQPSRLHDRLVYNQSDGEWTTEFLYP
ncbi:MAG: pyridoxamine 5'-phosphate oxidase [Proteobacteria bacterium]|nr:pyridoxamine 5'-phosphate oxidase [Pseudomonadota bacterium]